MKIRSLFILLIILPSLSYGLDWRALYQSDYATFWKKYEKVRETAQSCSTEDGVMVFLKSATDLMGNAEVSEASSETIELMAKENTSCLLVALESSASSVRDTISMFLAAPLFSSSQEIYKSLDPAFASGAYPATEAAYYRAAESANKSLKSDAKRRAL